MVASRTWPWWATVGVGLLGVGAGVVIGGGVAPRLYDWETEWTIDASLEDVYALMSGSDNTFWPSMHIAEIQPDAAAVDHRVVHYSVKQAASVARFAPPFEIYARMTVIEPLKHWRQVVTGDLVGVLETRFYSRPDGGSRIIFNWYVRVSNPLFNLAGYVAEPVFRASHDHVMREGEAGLRRQVGALAPAR